MFNVVAHEKKVFVAGTNKRLSVSESIPSKRM